MCGPEIAAAGIHHPADRNPKRQRAQTLFPTTSPSRNLHGQVVSSTDPKLARTRRISPRSRVSFRCLMSLIILFTFTSLLSGQDQKKPKPKRRPNPVMQPITDVEGLPRVLLIGDSISIGYTLPVREMLNGIANVHRPLTNCGPTTKGIQQIDKWLGDGKWDVIHFNFGLHDLKYMGPKGQNLADPRAPDSKPQVPIDQYDKNLRKLVQRLKKTGAKLIWRTTTPVPTGTRGRVVGDSVKYNEVAAKIMKEHGIEIDDQYTFAIKQLDKIQRKADVHFTPSGSRQLAEQTVKSIKQAIKK